MKPQTLTIDSEVLEEFRNNFNGTMAFLMREMQNRRLYEGTISAKIDITIEERRDTTGEIIRTVEIAPEVNMKMGAKAKVECKKKGGLFMRMNQEGTPVVGSCQVDIEELLAAEEE